LPNYYDPGAPEDYCKEFQILNAASFSEWFFSTVEHWNQLG